MTAASVRIIGGHTPYREALEGKLEADRFAVVESGGDVLVICCLTEVQWMHAADSVSQRPTVVVVADDDIGSYSRALKLGAGVVHLDTSTDVMVGVVRAAIAGDALVPLEIAQTLASWRPLSAGQVAKETFEDVELTIVDGLLSCWTVARMASELSYSDRTIRRKLQGIYHKLGVSGRGEAIEELRSRAQS